MSKVAFLIVFASVSCCLANDDQIFQQTSKPFFPTSSSSISTSTKGAIQFSTGGDVQKPAVISSGPQPPILPLQTRPAIQPDISFSTNPDANPIKTGDNNRQHNDPRFCTKIQDPVCGSNGRTYGNLCMLTQDQRSDPNIVLSKQGEC